jgi:hypothetical protein
MQIEQIEKKQAYIKNKMLLASSANKERYLQLYERLETLKIYNCGCGGQHFAEINRELSQFENQQVIEYLQETFDTQEEILRKYFEQIKQEELLPSIERAESKIKDAIIPTLLLLYFLRKTRINKAIQEVQTTSYEKGKTSAVRELKADGVTVERPTTPSIQTSLNAFEREAITEQITQDINLKGRNIVMEGIAKGVAATAIVQALRRDLVKEYDKRVQNITATLVGENINRARRDVFTSSLTVVGYVRSEVMDSRTCAICQSIDGRFVLPDDPFSKVDIIHSNCRGIWVPVTKQSDIPKNTGIPKSIVDNFDTVGGVPIANSFTQLKKPIIKK